MTESISNKIYELFKSTPDDISVGFGYKQVNGQYTDEKSIVFGVKTKLPLSELAEKDMLPSTVEIDGVIYNTDVVQNRGMNFLACDNSSSNPCFPYGYPPNIELTPNSQTQRPLKGGSTISNWAGTGTMGFIAKHTRTGKLVGVTNSHVLYIVSYNSTSIQQSPQLPSYPFGNVSSIFQMPFSNPATYNNNEKIIGKSLYIKRLVKKPFYNDIDAGIISLTEKDRYLFDRVTTESWKQVGLDIGTTPPPFATTYELDHLLDDPNLEISSSGARTGPKEGACGLKISQINVVTYIGFDYTFQGAIQFTRINPDCLWPAGPGDSGSAMFAKIGGVWKIIGLIFAAAGDYSSAVVCRIDKIAEQLGIEAWDGTVTPTSFIDPATIKNIVTAGVTGDDSITVGGKVYKQSGSTIFPPGDYPNYNYIVDMYFGGCDSSPVRTYVTSTVPAVINKWYKYNDPYYSTYPIKVIASTDIFGIYLYTSTFQQTPSDTCVL
jgi:hypothetical protein